MRSGPSRRGWIALSALAALAVTVAWPSAARAQETCDGDAGGPPPDFGQLVETFPSHNSLRIPRDGFVRFVYRGRVPPRPVLIVRDVEGAAVSGVVAVVGPELHWQASAPLAPQRLYTATASDILGGNAEVRFTTGDALSAGAGPSGFDGVTSVTSERVGASDICGDEEARAVTVAWKFARSSPWPQTELSYVVYETRGPAISGPIERARDRGRLSTTPCAQGADQCVTFRLSSANAAGPACFSVQVYDPLGRTVENAVEKCINLDAGNYFYGCSVARRPANDLTNSRGHGAARPAWGAWLAAGLAGAAIIARRVRRRAV